MFWCIRACMTREDVCLPGANGSGPGALPGPFGGPAPARDTEHRARLGQSGSERLSRLYHREENGKYLADLYNQAISANF